MQDISKEGMKHLKSNVHSMIWDVTQLRFLQLTCLGIVFIECSTETLRDKLQEGCYILQCKKNALQKVESPSNSTWYNA